MYIISCLSSKWPLGVSAVEQGLAHWMLVHPHHQLQGAACTALPALHVQGFTTLLTVVLTALGYQEVTHAQVRIHRTKNYISASPVHYFTIHLKITSTTLFLSHM